MSRLTQAAVPGLAVIGLLGLGLAATADAHVAEDPVSTVGHVCDQVGWQNEWGDHRHGDQWGDHAHQGAPATAGHHGSPEHHGSETANHGPRNAGHGHER